MSRRIHPNRCGYSFFELIAALAAAAVLVVGMASSIGVALKASSTSTTPAANTLAALNMLNEMASDLMYARVLSEKGAAAVTATIPDRTDADTAVDTVRYSWAGAAGNPLVRRYNGGTSATALANVYDFSVRYHPASGPVELVFVTLRTSADSRSAVETTIPLLNRP